MLDQNMDPAPKEECMRSIRLDWLNEYVMHMHDDEGHRLSRWRVSHDVRDEEENAMAEKKIDWEFQVLKGSRWKQLFRVVWSEEKGRYGLFASTRFEKGSVITALVRGESVSGIDLRTTVPSPKNLGVGAKWAARTDSENVGGAANTVMINGVVRAMIRILPNMEVAVLANKVDGNDDKNSSIYRDNRMMFNYGLLDCVVYDTERECGFERMARMGVVIEFGKMLGTFTIEYIDGKRTLLTEEEVKARLVKVPAIVAMGKKRKAEAQMETNSEIIGEG